MSVSVRVEPSMLKWALDRSGLKPDSKKFDRYAKWARGEGFPTFKQLEEFAHATHAPLGYLFLEAPPVETVPISDFRTLPDSDLTVPSPDLLDTIYEAQQRQDWFRSYASAQGYEPLKFVGSAKLSESPQQWAHAISAELGFDLDARHRFRSWEAALRRLVDLIEDLGVLVMISGIVGNNTHRALRVKEFRGFALSDPLAPVIFVNGVDTKSAQMFTLVHELAHIWLGDSGLSDAKMKGAVGDEHEIWANKVAAEVLVPMASLRETFQDSAELSELQRLSRHYKVSTLVILKRIFDGGWLKWNEYRERYESEVERVRAIADRSKGSGGDYYNTQPLRISQSFARAVVVDALEGRTLYRDAYRLLRSAKPSTFDGMAERLGVA